MYILRVVNVIFFCKRIDVWGCEAHSKNLVQIDRLLNRAFRYGYVEKMESILSPVYTTQTNSGSTRDKTNPGYFLSCKHC